MGSTNFMSTSCNAGVKYNLKGHFIQANQDMEGIDSLFKTFMALVVDILKEIILFSQTFSGSIRLLN